VQPARTYACVCRAAIAQTNAKRPLKLPKTKRGPRDTNATLAAKKQTQHTHAHALPIAHAAAARRQLRRDWRGHELTIMHT